MTEGTTNKRKGKTKRGNKAKPYNGWKKGKQKRRMKDLESN